MAQLADILIPISCFLAIFGVLYIYFTTRHRERIALIEKGVDANLFNRKQTRFFFALKLGLLAIGVALGILIGHLLHVNAGLDDDVAMPSMIFLCGGIALVASFFIERKLKEKDNVNDNE